MKNLVAQSAFALPGYSAAVVRVLQVSFQVISSGQMALPVRHSMARQDPAGTQLVEGEEKDIKVTDELSLILETKQCLAGEYSHILDSLLSRSREIGKATDIQILDAMDRLLSGTSQVIGYDRKDSPSSLLLRAIQQLQIQFDANGEPLLDGQLLVRRDGDQITQVKLTDLIGEYLGPTNPEEASQLAKILEHKLHEQRQGAVDF